MISVQNPTRHKLEEALMVFQKSKPLFSHFFLSKNLLRIIRDVYYFVLLSFFQQRMGQLFRAGEMDENAK